ncbi:Pre-piRNA 3'-exonuclease trimmer [Holothuria leucospilota]|uniref:Pre-piRNA 3'-exonuclease trimmer n=1 Tax=Holothuria leucospilota TaxID=206669 RepID=A0A9Q1CE87_HOLLE|nr:Pre-piRNA 3'-exonuclease trimmer [Holothuria leucospilota]
MCDVTKDNFTQVYPEIEQSLRHASFIALDLEFTGLTAEGEHVNSLFDSIEYRYQKLKMMAQKFSIPQLGLTAFVKMKEGNKYEAFTYNFYLFPASWGPVDSWLTCQASSLKFLCCHEFDFNKWIYRGVSFLTKKQEEDLRKMMKESPFNLARDIDDDNMMKDIIRKVGDWLSQEQDDVMCIGEFDALQGLYLQLGLKRAFPSVNIEVKDSGEINMIPLLSINSLTSLFCLLLDSIIDNLLGFTKVFQLLIECKKPLVGHNCLTDMVLIYEKFHCPLPEKLSEFKKNVHEMFPCVIDTKTIMKEYRRKFRNLGIDIPSTALQSLYLSVKSAAVKMSVMDTPAIIIHHNSTKYEHAEHLHEAGYDSYVSGYVFLTLAHILSVNNLGQASTTLVTFHDYLQVLKPCTNKLNVIRASVDHLALGGKEDSSSYPHWLHVQAKHSTLDASELADLLQEYSTVDVQLLNQKTAVVAVRSVTGCRKILKDFRKHETLKITRYNVIQHNKVVRYSLWGALALMGTVCVWALFGGKPSDTG